MKNLLVGLMLSLISLSALAGYGNTHEVRSYTKKDGTYVEQHRAGNPGSGVHCHNNECY